MKKPENISESLGFDASTHDGLWASVEDTVENLPGVKPKGWQRVLRKFVDVFSGTRPDQFPCDDKSLFPPYDP